MVNQTFKTKKKHQNKNIPTLLPSKHQRHLVTAIPNYVIIKDPQTKNCSYKKNYQSFRESSASKYQKINKNSEPMKKN